MEEKKGEWEWKESDSAQRTALKIRICWACEAFIYHISPSNLGVLISKLSAILSDISAQYFTAVSRRLKAFPVSVGRCFKPHANGHKIWVVMGRKNEIQAAETLESRWEGSLEKRVCARVRGHINVAPCHIFFLCLNNSQVQEVGIEGILRSLQVSRFIRLWRSVNHRHAEQKRNVWSESHQLPSLKPTTANVLPTPEPGAGHKLWLFDQYYSNSTDTWSFSVLPWQNGKIMEKNRGYIFRFSCCFLI